MALRAGPSRPDALSLLGAACDHRPTASLPSAVQAPGGVALARWSGAATLPPSPPVHPSSAPWASSAQDPVCWLQRPVPLRRTEESGSDWDQSPEEVAGGPHPTPPLLVDFPPGIKVEEEEQEGGRRRGHRCQAARGQAWGGCGPPTLPARLSDGMRFPA